MKHSRASLCALLPVLVGVGCGDSPPTSDGSVSASADSAAAAGDATKGADTAALGTDGGAADTATTPASTTPAMPSGKYRVTTWTCGPKDVKQFASTQGIQSMDLTFGSPNGTLEVTYAATCVRTSAITFSYPTATALTTTTGALTCTPTCPANQCTPAPAANPPQVDTFMLTPSATAVLLARPLTAAILTPTSLQGLAGCAAGDTETQVLTKL